MAKPLDVLVVGRTSESGAPGAAVPSDITSWLNHQRILADPIGDRGQLACSDLGCKLRRFLEDRWDTCRISDHHRHGVRI